MIDPFQKALNDVEADLSALQAIEQRLIEGLKADSAELRKLQDSLKRRKATKKDQNAVHDLEAKHKTFVAQKAKLADSAKAAETRFYAAIDAEHEKHVVQIRGFCSYVIGTGEGDAGIKYLLDEAKSFDSLKGNFSQRRAKFSEICNVLGAVADACDKQRGSAFPTDSKIAQYERLQDRDPERASAVLP